MPELGTGSESSRSNKNNPPPRPSHSLNFDAGRLTGRHYKSGADLPRETGKNISSTWKNAGNASRESRMSGEMLGDLLKVLAKSNKSHLLEQFRILPAEIQKSVADELQKIYKDPSEANRDGYKRTIAKLEELLDAQARSARG